MKEDKLSVRIIKKLQLINGPILLDETDKQALKNHPKDTPINKLADSLKLAQSRFPLSLISTPQKILIFSSVLCLFGWTLAFNEYNWIWVVVVCACIYFYFSTEEAQLDQSSEWLINKQLALDKLTQAEFTEDSVFVNFIMQQVWNVIDTKLLTNFMDLLEDNFIYLNPPPFISDISIKSFGLGKHAPTLSSVKVHPKSSKKDSVMLDCMLTVQPTPASDPKENINVELDAKIGERQIKVIGVPIILTNVGFTLKVRIHAILQSGFPILKFIRISLLQTPEIKFSAKPMNVNLNVMHLPVISKFIGIVLQKTIADLCLAPNVLTLNAHKLLTGDLSSSTSGCVMGVVKVVIRRAKDLLAADIGNNSDPYVGIGFSDNRREFQESTRILYKTLNPEFNETHFINITEQHIFKNESLRVHVYDYDKLSADDSLGFYTIPINSLVDHVGVQPLVNGWQTLHEEGSKDVVKDKHGNTSYLDMELEFYPTMIVDKLYGKEEIKVEELAGSGLATVVDGIRYPSGILVVHIEKASKLSIPNSEKPPSTYICVYNDKQQIMQTHPRIHNSEPLFDEVDEIFIKDWRRLKLKFKVLVLKSSAKDPLLGSFEMDVNDFFDKEFYMTKTKWHAISNGIGFGNLKVSLTFHPILFQIPKQLLGATRGTLTINSLKITNPLPFPTNASTLTIKFNSPLIEPPEYQCKDLLVSAQELLHGGICWDEGGVFTCDHRHQTAIDVYLMIDGVGKCGGVLWLQDLGDTTDATNFSIDLTSEDSSIKLEFMYTFIARVDDVAVESLENEDIHSDAQSTVSQSSEGKVRKVDRFGKRLKGMFKHRK